MVRMSDVVRGIVRDKPADARPGAGAARSAARAAGPAAGPSPRRAAPAPRRAGSAAAHDEPPRAVETASLDTLPLEPAIPRDAGRERGAALHRDPALPGARARDHAHGRLVPVGGARGLVERCAASLERSGDLFWVANNAAAPAGVDYLAVHQARVAVLAMRIGANVGYDRTPRVQLGMAGCLIDVGLWQLPEGLLRRLDALSAEEQTLYRSHPRLSVELDPALVAAERGDRRRGAPASRARAGPGLPAGPARARPSSQDAKILGLVDTYTGLTMPPPPRPRLRPHEAIREIVRTKHERVPVRARQGAALGDLGVSARHPGAPEHRRGRARDRGEPQSSAAPARRDRRRRQGPAPGVAQDDRPRRTRRSSTSRAPWRRAAGEGGGARHRRGVQLMAQYEMNLRDYWLIVRRRRMIIITSTVAGRPPQPRSRPAEGPQLPGDRGGQVRAVDPDVGAARGGALVLERRLDRDAGRRSSRAIRSSRRSRSGWGGCRRCSARRGPRDAKGYWAALDAISGKLRVTRRAEHEHPRDHGDLAEPARGARPRQRHRGGRTASSTSRCGTRASPRRGGSSRTSSRTSRRARGAPRRRSGRSARPTGSSRPAPSPRCCSRSSPRCGATSRRRASSGSSSRRSSSG